VATILMIFSRITDQIGKFRGVFKRMIMFCLEDWVPFGYATARKQCYIGRLAQMHSQRAVT